MNFLLPNNVVFVQLIGFAALGFSVLVFQFNKREKMLKLQICGSLLYAIHFYLLSAFTGSAMNLVGVVRNATYIKFPKKHSFLIPGIFIAIFCIAGFLTWQGPLSLLPIMGMVSGTMAFWQSNPRIIRLLSLVSPPLWLTYNAISGSYPGMIIEIILLASTLSGIYRFDIKKQKSPKQNARTSNLLDPNIAS